MTTQTDTPSILTRAGRFVQANPVIPLIVLLLVLVAVLETMRPGIVNERWIANTVKFAIPLAMLCLLYTSPSPRDRQKSRMPSSA